MRWTPIAVGLALLAAGCVGVGADGDEAANDPGNDTAAPTARAQARTGAPRSTGSPNGTVASVPTWEVGDWWTYDLSTAGGTREVTFLVQNRTDGVYQLLVDDRELAVVDAFYDLPYVGPIQVDTLEAGEGADATRLFHWPLEDGKRWTTQWNGEQRAVMAEAAQIPLAEGTGSGFELTAVTDGEIFANYTYAPSVGWFTRLSLPSVGVTYELVAVGSNATTTVLDVTAQQVHEDEDRPAGAATFTVPERADELAIERGGDGSLFAQAALLVGPKGTPHPFVTQPCQDCSPYRFETIDATPGRWTLTWAATDLASTAGIHEWLHVWWLDAVERTPAGSNVD